MTPAQLRRLAHQGRAKAAKLRATADALEEQARELERLAGMAEEFSHKRLRRATLAADMDTDQRLAISKGATGEDPFADAIRARNYTQRALAEAIDIAPATLTLYRQGRRIPRAKAEAIEKLTGWKADGRHWPGGVSDGE